MGKTIRIILKALGLTVAYAVFIAIQCAVLIIIFWRAGSSINRVPAGLSDCLICGVGLILALAVPLHYLMRRKLTGVLSYLSALEAFIFVIPTAASTIYYSGFPTPFFASDSPGLMVFQGATMLLMMIVPVAYALFYLYLVIEKNISASREKSGEGR